MIDWRKHIVCNPQILCGKPTIKDTRIAEALIIEKFAEGESLEQILEAHPHLNKDAVYACLSYAAESLNNEITYPIAS